jgi:ankyrin repeat protein
MRLVLPTIVLLVIFYQAVEAEFSNNIDPPNKFDLPMAAPSEPPLDLQLQQAATTGDLQKIETLLQQGAAINGVDSRGVTPLMFAAKNDQMAVIQLLLAKGARIDAQDNKSITALVYACSKNNHAIAMALILKGANCNLIDESGRLVWPLNCAAQNGDVTLLAALLDHQAEINRASDWGTPVANAVLWSQWDAFNFLIGKSADPNIPDSFEDWGRTPLMEVARCSSGDPQEALLRTQALLKVGANPNLKSKSGMTALMYTCLYDTPIVAQALIDAGTDINATNSDGETALTLAADRGHQDMVDLLKNRRAIRCDIHIIARTKPTTPLTPAQAWVLAIDAIYNQTQGNNHYFLGSQDEHYPSAFQSGLKDNFGITDKASLAKELDYLSSTGTRAQAQIDGAKEAALSDKDFEAAFKFLPWNPEAEARARATRKSYLKWKTQSGMGHDLCISVRLVNEAYVAGYLNDEEAWSLLMPIGRQVQKNFNSWEELGENSLDSYEMAHGVRETGFEACFQLLSNPKDPNSPWNECPWNTDLSQTGLKTK